MKTPIAALALVTLVTGLASAQTSLDTVAALVRSQSLLPSGEVPLVVLNPADHENPRQTYSMVRTTNPDGTVTVSWKSARVDSSQTFRADGTLIHSRQADLVKNSVVEETVDPGRTSVRTVITNQGQVKSDKKASLNPGIALRGELQNLVVQAWKAGVRDGLKFQSLSPDGGLPGDFQILFKTTSDPLSLTDKYTYPAEFRSALGRKDSVVADMSLQGIASFFYPHHFYLVYTPAPGGLEFAGYFGEDPKAPTFQYVPR
jgi:hypothetical protein